VSVFRHLIACLILAVPALAAEHDLAAALPAPRADSLLAKLEPGPGGSADLPKGLSLERKLRPLADGTFLVVETRLTNRADTPLQPQGVRVLDVAFRIADDQDSARYRPLTYRNDTWYGSTYWTGPDWTRVGKDWHHPGKNTPAVRRFTCPADGRVAITGRAHKAHVEPKSDGVRLAIRHGAKTVWRAEIDGGDAQGVEHQLTLDVKRGDALRFVVHKRGQIYCDTTHWDPLVAYEGGKSTQASSGFSTKKQGEGGWSYEMEAPRGETAGLPVLRTLGRDLLIQEHPLGPGAAVQCSGADALPVLILAAGDGQSALAAALLGSAPWRLNASFGEDGRLRLRLESRGAAARPLPPGESCDLPQVALAPCDGGWRTGAAALQRLFASERHREVTGNLRRQLDSAFADLDGAAAERPELDLLLMVQDDWRQQDKLDGTATSLARAIESHIERSRRLLADLRGKHGPHILQEEAERLDQLAAEARAPDLSPKNLRSLYARVRWLKRRIILANPRMQFGPMLFCKRVPTSYSHLVMQYYGWRARPGGGPFVLTEPGRSLDTRRLFDAAEGCVLEPRLSWDAQRIVFSYVHCPDGPLPHGPLLNDEDKGFYHLWTVNADGTGLRQLTRGPYDDLMPTRLPDGGIAFSSTRRKGYARCFGGQFSRRWHVYTLYRCDGDGSNIRPLSVHDTNEWFPTVSNTGHVLYARWDYIDRDAVTHQNLWATRPDGTNPVALWGNAAPKPHCTFQMQPVPNSSQLIFTASAHHSIAGGPICLLDPAVHDNAQAAISRITPDIPFPEAESRTIREYYTAPWPLSEDYYLVAYSPRPLQWEPRANFRDALGIYTLDRWGNRELLYRDPDIGSTNPCPLAPRPKPPVLASPLHPDAAPQAAEETGEMVLLDVYQGLGDVPRDTIKSLRIVQIFPKTTNVANRPPIGAAREENARAVLGTVPVEADGSARFRVPAHTPVLFQALDADGFAYQTMRSLTYVQPGERISCIGCHEHRGMAPPSRNAPLALRRPASQLEPGPFGGEPFSYARVVQPVLDEHCVKCHSGADAEKGIVLTGEPAGAFSRSYNALMKGPDFWGGGTNPANAAKALVPRFGGRNRVQRTPPGGLYGARGSRLIQMLRKGHNKVELSDAELRRLALWIDLNAIFYGVYRPEQQARQRRGQPVPMPAIQ
jgi:hypothetical protein